MILVVIFVVGFRRVIFSVYMENRAVGVTLKKLYLGVHCGRVVCACYMVHESVCDNRCYISPFTFIFHFLQSNC